MVEVTASLGSNIEPRIHLSGAVESLGALFPGLQISPVYESPAIGFEGASFLNLVVAFDTQMALLKIQEELRFIEACHDRVRDGEKFSDRSLDIDILTYGALVGEVAGMTVPRDDITRYAFVLKPLADLRPEGLHPELKVSYAELWRAFSEKDRQPLRKLPIL
jgi:2-amino-4-hydroxy-6-hydroxymethyldihydropteridine diphosphokinase